MRYAFTLLEGHREELERTLKIGDGKESAAYIVCGVSRIARDPWTRSGAVRLISRAIVPVPDVVSRSKTHVTWSTRSFLKMVGACENDGTALLIAHSHPAGEDAFSPQDDANEATLFDYGLQKLGDDSVFGSMLLRDDGSLIGRAWTGAPVRTVPFESISTIGRSWRFEHDGPQVPVRSQFSRQALAFGDTLDGVVRNLRVGIVGCGATGSATATMLARIGVGRQALIDDDTVDVTNLNRLHAASQSDADLARPKAQMLAEAIAALGLGCSVQPVVAHAGADESLDALRCCDIIFGCTDDHFGRAVINRIAYYYAIPVIDMGLVVRLNKAKTGLSHLDARVTVVQPETPCLLCREVIDPERLRADSERRADPERYERLKAEAYVVGGGDPSPSVVTFTTETACIAANELLHRLTGFRGDGVHADQRCRYFLESEESLTGLPSRSGCKICDATTIWGRGDATPLLGMVR